MTEEAPPQYIITSEFTSTIQPQTQLFSDDVTVENQQIRGEKIFVLLKWQY